MAPEGLSRCQNSDESETNAKYVHNSARYTPDNEKVVEM